MTTEGKRRFRLSLSTSILIGLGFGVFCGITFGEYCASLRVLGDAFIKLLQMSILPYLVVSLVAGIGGLSYDQAKRLAIRAGLLLVLLWGIGFAIILALPLAFPEVESASFFSTSLIETRENVDFVDLYIPWNPFRSLANNAIPAVVLFSLSVGIGLIGVKDKQGLIHPLNILSAVLMRVAQFVVKLTPLGVFAISASAAGTMTLEEFGRLQPYFICFIIGALLLGFWILPALLAALTPLRYKDIVGQSRDALLTGFTTGNLFIVLPILIKNCKDLFESYRLEHEDAPSSIDILVPVSFNFPNLGKLLILLFVPFGAWFYGITLSASDYPNLVFSGLFSFFGSVEVALPFLLDLVEIPADAFQLYLVTGVINGRFATLVAAMSLLVFTLLATCAITGFFSVNRRKLLIYGVTSLVLTAASVIGARTLLRASLRHTYTKDKVIASMQLLHNPLPATVHTEIPPPPAVSDSERSRLDRIRQRGILRVGYHADALPFSFFNGAGHLVGLDIDLAHGLARDLGVELEFVPFEYQTLSRQLRENHFDIAMSGIPLTPDYLEEVTFSHPYLDLTWAFVVRDYRRREFTDLETIKGLNDITIGVVPTRSFLLPGLRELFPSARVVPLKSFREFFERQTAEVDAILISAEAGSAWTLLYPRYQVVVPKPTRYVKPVAYPLAGGDQELLNYVNSWIDIKKRDGTLEEMYDYWILGRGAVERHPRWSIIRDVLHWVE